MSLRIPRRIRVVDARYGQRYYADPRDTIAGPHSLVVLAAVIEAVAEVLGDRRSYSGSASQVIGRRASKGRRPIFRPLDVAVVVAADTQHIYARDTADVIEVIRDPSTGGLRHFQIVEHALRNASRSTSVFNCLARTLYLASLAVGHLSPAEFELPRVA